MGSSSVIILKWFLVMVVQGSDFGVIMPEYDGWTNRAACEQQKVLQMLVAHEMDHVMGKRTGYMCVALPRKQQA